MICNLGDLMSLRHPVCVTWKVWRDSLIYDMAHTYVTWLIHVCGMTPSRLPWLTYMCDLTHSCAPWLIHMWHDSFICVNGHIHTWHVWLIQIGHDSFIHGMPHSCVCHTHASAVTPDVWSDAFKKKSCVTWNVYTCDMSHIWNASESFIVWHDAHECRVFLRVAFFFFLSWVASTRCVLFGDTTYSLCAMTPSCVTWRTDSNLSESEFFLTVTLGKTERRPSTVVVRETSAFAMFFQYPPHPRNTHYQFSIKLYSHRLCVMGGFHHASEQLACTRLYAMVFRILEHFFVCVSRRGPEPIYITQIALFIKSRSRRAFFWKTRLFREIMAWQWGTGEERGEIIVIRAVWTHRRNTQMRSIFSKVTVCIGFISAWFRLYVCGSDNSVPLLLRN